MKTFMTGLLKGRITRWSILAGLAVVLVWAGPSIAGVKQTFTGGSWYLALNLGEWSVTPSGNIHVRGMGGVEMWVADNALPTGRLTFEGNGNYDAQLNGVGSGTGVLEVGTWAVVDDVPVFTASPTGGQWVVQWEAKGNLFGPLEVKFVGHGVAGEVEGMQFVLTGQRSQGAPSALGSGEILDPHEQK